MTHKTVSMKILSGNAERGRREREGGGYGKRLEEKGNILEREGLGMWMNKMS